jgi:4-amino-4-deoxy-L-arabinose transferase-like glycosyltransferase
MPAVSVRASRLWLASILLVYLLLASAYAAYTPAWQAPDEPAHYNYIRYIAEHGTLPELKPGDYPAGYLEEIKAARFARPYSIDPIRYESHQPPLYYLLATPVFLLGRAVGMETPLLPLRLFSVALSLFSLLVAYRLVRVLTPNRPMIALGTVAFMAFLPMRLAVTGAVNNDVLVELLLGLAVWQAVVMGRDGWNTRRSLLLGFTVGLALLTKLQAYVAAPLAFFAWAWAAGTARRAHRPLLPLIRQGALVLVLALLLVSPWLARNAAIYGPCDLLGMVRHDAVAGGQMTTAALLAERGALGALRRLLQTTFQSFWGQFGWMGVPLHPRVYKALAACTALALLGVLDSARLLWGAARDSRRAYQMMLLAAWGVLTVAGFLWYNLQYVQHQGRYLLPALPVWALLFTCGMQRLYAHAPRWVLGVLGVAALGLLILATVSRDLKGYALLLVVASAALVVVGHSVERRWLSVPLPGTYLALAGFAAWCLTVLVPALTP